MEIRRKHTKSYITIILVDLIIQTNLDWLLNEPNYQLFFRGSVASQSFIELSQYVSL